MKLRILIITLLTGLAGISRAVDPAPGVVDPEPQPAQSPAPPPVRSEPRPGPVDFFMPNPAEMPGAAPHIQPSDPRAVAQPSPGTSVLEGF